MRRIVRPHAREPMSWRKTARQVRQDMPRVMSTAPEEENPICECRDRRWLAHNSGSGVQRLSHDRCEYIGLISLRDRESRAGMKHLV